KLYSYTSFNNEITELKDFISDRNAFISSNAEVNRTGPSITNVNYTSTAGAWLPLAATEAVNVTAEVSSANGLDRVTLYYATGLVGKFAKVTMQDDGAHNDGAAGDGIY